MAEVMDAAWAFAPTTASAASLTYGPGVQLQFAQTRNFTN